MGRLKTKALVKTVCVDAALVGGELDEPAAAPAALLDCPFEHRPADAAGALSSGNAHALDLAARHALQAEPGNKTELQNADEMPAAVGNRENVVRIALDGRERVTVAGVQRGPGVLAAAADRVIRKQRDDPWQIVPRGPAKGDRARARTRAVTASGHSRRPFFVGSPRGLRLPRL